MAEKESEKEFSKIFLDDSWRLSNKAYPFLFSHFGVHSPSEVNDLTESETIKAMLRYLEDIIQEKRPLNRTDLFHIVQILKKRDEQHFTYFPGSHQSPVMIEEKLSSIPYKNLADTISLLISDFDSSHVLPRGMLETKNLSENEKDIQILKLKFAELDSAQKNIEKDLDEKNELLYELLYGKEVSYGTQYLPISIYLDTNSPKVIFEVYAAVLDFVKSIGFEKAVELKDRKGSWIKKIIGKSLTPLNSEEVTDRLKEAEYGIEVNAILKPLSEIEKNQSEALLNITKSVENAPNAAIRIGSLIVVKLTEESTGSVQIMARTLSIKEVYLLNKKPALLDSPQKLLTALSEVVEDSQDGQLKPN